MFKSLKSLIKLIMMSTIITIGFLVVSLFLVEGIGRATGLLSPFRSMMRMSATKGYELDPAQPHINSHGLRDREFSLQKMPNTFRIVTLGDSFTYGQGVLSQETYVKQLEMLLNVQREGQSLRYEVLNAGVPGYNTRQEFLHLKEVGLQFEPDIVLIGYNMNDADLGFMGVRNRGGQDGLMRVKKWMKDNIALYNVIRVRLKRLSHLVKSIGFRLGLSPSTLPSLQQAAAGQPSAGWDLSRQSLANIAEISKQHGIPVVLAIYPNLLNLNDTYSFKDAHTLVAKTATEFGMKVVDLFPKFNGLDAPTLWISPKDSHPNASANTLAARGIYEGLLDHNLIDVTTHQSSTASRK